MVGKAKATHPDATHYKIRVSRPVPVAGTVLNPGEKHTVKAAVYEQIDKEVIVEAVPLVIS